EVGKARRVAVLGTPGAMRADGYAEEAAHASQLMLAPLLEVLEAGRADGSFPSADPLRDAAMIRAMVWDAAGLPLARHRAASRDEARASLMSFCRRALGSEPNRYEAS